MTHLVRGRWFRRATLGVCGLAILAGTGGCPPPQGPQEVPPPAPPRDLSEIIRTIERNAALMNKALWSSSVSVTARFQDEKGKEHIYNLDGSFLFQRPRRLRIDLRPGIGDQVMQIGSNAETYWLWIEPEIGVMRWGRHRHAGKPCAGSVSVRPDQLAAALGLEGLPKGGGGLIGPARKYGKRYDILYYLAKPPGGDEGAKPEAPETGDGPFGGGYLLAREYWVERTPPHMIRVVQFRDALGRVAMSAFLDDYRPAWEGGPLVAHACSISWPQDEGRFSLSMARTRGLLPGQVKPGAFDRPTEAELPSGVRDVIQVDAACDESEAAEPPEESGQVDGGTARPCGTGFHVGPLSNRSLNAGTKPVLLRVRQEPTNAICFTGPAPSGPSSQSSCRPISATATKQRELL